ncbi:MAG: glycosyltransferase family 39 protein, partial [Opitutus sp.]
MTSRLRPFVSPLWVLIALSAWIGWLRAPSLHVTLWNVDESIHAAAARTLLEGGVMYRDAVDQRTPLTYYVFAAIFGVGGVNNLFAVRVVITAMIAATAFGLFVIGRKTNGRVTGLCAAFLFAAFSSHLLYAQDTYAAHTEWFVAFFSTTAALIFLHAESVPRFGRSLLIGAICALSFLSKQPGLTDLGAPVGTLIYLGLLRAAPRREIWRSLGGIVTGFLLTVLPVAALFVIAGAWKDGIFYTWTYNVQFYGPEIGWGDRLLSIAPFFASLAHVYPFVLIAIVLAVIGLALSVVQFRYLATEYVRRRADGYLILWCVTSLVGAMSSGRGYAHYFFQCLPPFAWLAARAGDWLWAQISSTHSNLKRGLAGIGFVALAVSALWTPLGARKVAPPPVDPAIPIASFIRAHSTPADKIFVWGYNPDIYLYANRAPASRFFYCSFQTGLIPWTNEVPGVDTTYAIVRGSMETLLADLARHPPAFIVDCGVGPHRRFSKYPVQNFDVLYSLIQSHYVEVDPSS